jgi:hypothetical protein
VVVLTGTHGTGAAAAAPAKPRFPQVDARRFPHGCLLLAPTAAATAHFPCQTEMSPPELRSDTFATVGLRFQLVSTDSEIWLDRVRPVPMPNAVGVPLFAASSDFDSRRYARSYCSIDTTLLWRWLAVFTNGLYFYRLLIAFLLRRTLEARPLPEKSDSQQNNYISHARWC